MPNPTLSFDPSPFGLDIPAKFILIGVGASRVVQVKNWQSNVEVQIADPSIATLTAGKPDTYTLTGVNGGRTWLTVLLNKKTVEKWIVYTASLMHTKAACFIVNGTKNATTTTAQAVMDAFAQTTGPILMKANVDIAIENVPIPALTPTDFTGVYQYGTWGQTKTLRKSRSKTADMNIYFVSRIDRLYRTDADWGKTLPGRNYIFIADHHTAHQLGVTVAHEIAHAMGKLLHSRSASDVMGPGLGTDLSAMDIIRIRRGDPSPYPEFDQRSMGI